MATIRLFCDCGTEIEIELVDEVYSIAELKRHRQCSVCQGHERDKALAGIDGTLRLISSAISKLTELERQLVPLKEKRVLSLDDVHRIIAPAVIDQARALTD